ncbi:hypothetical protein ABW49_21435 [Enterobacter asburiae]|nr:hypothetical protein ABW49_21435 [Enterobacter asburiae]
MALTRFRPKGSFLPAGMTAQLRLNVMVIISIPGKITRAMTILLDLLMSILRFLRFRLLYQGGD